MSISKIEHWKNIWKENFFKYLLIVFPMLVQFCYVCKYAVNIPRYDDYDSILEFTCNFKKSPFPQNIYHLFDQHIGHRILTTRLFSIIYYYICGNIDFRAIIFVNFFLALLLFFALWHFIKPLVPKNWPYAAAVLSICLFDIINCDSSNWAMSGIQNYGVTLFFVASLIFYSKNTLSYLYLAVLFQVLCIYTGGNGHMGSLFIVLFNVFGGDKRRIVASLLAALIFSILYYVNYTSVQSTYTDDLEKVVPFFLHTVGSHFSFEYGIFAGLVLLGLMAILFFKKINRLPQSDMLSLPILCIGGYAIGSEIALSFFQGNLPVIVAYSSQALIYSHLIVILCSAYLFHKFEHDGLKMLVVTKLKIWRAPLITIVLLICGISYLFNYDDGKKRYESMYNTLLTERYFFPDSLKARNITEEACRLNIYCIENIRQKLPKP